MAPTTTDPSAIPSIVTWFALNIIIGNLNGWILKGSGRFAYPALLTFVHMLVCHVLADLCLHTVMRPENPRPITSAQLWKVRKLSCVFAASVAAGNIALQYIYVSFSQMVTAAGPLFTILLMYSMTGKRYSRGAYASMVPMCGGVMMCTAGEINFHWLGFTAVVAATLLRGVKSIIQGRLLTAPEDKFDSLTLLFHMSACSLAPLGAYVTLFEAAFLFDPLLFGGCPWVDELGVPAHRRGGRGVLTRWALVLLSAVVAFFLNLANFVVTKRTSAVTLQVLGNVKVVFSIGVSLLIFRNEVTTFAAAGCVITLAGVYAYNQAPAYQSPSADR